MTAEPVLALAWLLLLHLLADFVLQTERVATDKFGDGPAAWLALAIHVSIVAACVVPAILAWGLPGLGYAAIVVASHGAIDRAKIVWTRHVEAVAIARAHRAHEGAVPADGLGSASTAAPAALFVLDQVAHLAISAAAWAVLLAAAPLATSWVTATGRVLDRWDPDTVQRVVLFLVVGIDLVLVNVRAGLLFVAPLVRPRRDVAGRARWRPPRPTVDLPAPRVGATMGVIERLLIVVLVLTGAEAATACRRPRLARFRQLDDRAFAGTTSSHAGQSGGPRQRPYRRGGARPSRVPYGDASRQPRHRGPGGVAVPIAARDRARPPARGLARLSTGRAVVIDFRESMLHAADRRRPRVASAGRVATDLVALHRSTTPVSSTAASSTPARRGPHAAPGRPVVRPAPRRPARMPPRGLPSSRPTRIAAPIDGSDAGRPRPPHPSVPDATRAIRSDRSARRHANADGAPMSTASRR
jgi:hypothetical protein